MGIRHCATHPILTFFLKLKIVVNIAILALTKFRLLELETQIFKSFTSVNVSVIPF
jgi:hypothetical protein